MRLAIALTVLSISFPFSAAAKRADPKEHPPVKINRPAPRGGLLVYDSCMAGCAYASGVADSCHSYCGKMTENADAAKQQLADLCGGANGSKLAECVLEKRPTQTGPRGEVFNPPGRPEPGTVK